jgi:hypothetical protein
MLARLEARPKPKASIARSVRYWVYDGGLQISFGEGRSQIQDGLSDAPCQDSGSVDTAVPCDGDLAIHFCTAGSAASHPDDRSGRVCTRLCEMVVVGWSLHYGVPEIAVPKGKRTRPLVRLLSSG